MSFRTDIFHVAVWHGRQRPDGAGELFIGIGAAIAELPGSRIVGLLFFATVLVAALSSSISTVEVTVSYLIDHFALALPTAGGARVGVAPFVPGLPTADDTAVLDLYDRATAELFLPRTMFLLVLFLGWFYHEALDELGRRLASDRLPDSPPHSHSDYPSAPFALRLSPRLAIVRCQSVGANSTILAGSARTSGYEQACSRSLRQF